MKRVFDMINRKTMISPKENLILTALLVLWLVPAATASSQVFETGVDCPTGYRPVSVAAGDLNGDGNEDLVTADYGSSTVSVILNNGNGTYQQTVSYDAGSNPRSVAIGDFNGDSCPDLATANSGSDDTSIFLGNGDGTFLAGVNYAAGDDPNDIAIEDMDGDGHPDLAVTNSDGNSISTFFGNGDGTFQEARTIWTGDDPDHIAIEDMDSNGTPDIVVNFPDIDAIGIALGNGDGTFYLAGTFVVEGGAHAIIVSDIIGDSHLDVAVNSYSIGCVTILQGNGDGTLEAGTTTPISGGIGNMAIGDLDGDGIPDLAVERGYYDGTVGIFLGIGGGTFSPSPLGEYVIGNNPGSLIIRDLNNDDTPDLAVCCYGRDVVRTLEGNGDGTFQGTWFFDAGRSPQSVAADDLDGDGHQDLATGTTWDNTIEILMGLGDGTFQPPVHIDAVSSIKFIVIADLDRNGHPDMAVTTINRQLSIYPGNGDGSFQAPLIYSAYARWITVGDLNGDDIPDLVSAGQYGAVTVFIGIGDCTFQEGVNYIVGFHNVGAPYSVVIGDMDSDGIPDLVSANRASDDVSLLTGYGNGTFHLDSRHSVGPLDDMNPYAIVIGDFDENGPRDLAVLNNGTENISILLGNGNGTFQTPVLLPDAYAAEFLTSGDLNSDGHQDLVASGGSRITIFIGNGDGSFQPAAAYHAVPTALSVAISDLDNNGTQDLAVLNSSVDKVSILLNRMEIIPPTLTASLVCTPSSGTLPFSSLFQASMTNQYVEQARRFQYTIDVTLAGGQYYSNWRRGWQNVLAGETYIRQWSQTIPDVPGVVGSNLFELTVADVTPPPYNLPPYPPAGDTDRNGCTVTGVAP